MGDGACIMSPLELVECAQSEVQGLEVWVNWAVCISLGGGGGLFASFCLSQLTSVLNLDSVDHSCGLLSPQFGSGRCAHVSCRGRRPVASSLLGCAPTSSESVSPISTRPRDSQMDPGVSIDDGSSVGGSRSFVVPIMLLSSGAGAGAAH